MNNKKRENNKEINMYYDTQAWQDENIDAVLRFLFEYAAPAIKQLNYQHTLNIFQQLDISSSYLLFSLVQEQLPKRAKVIFMAEDYQGKQEMLLEVMAHLVKSPLYSY